MIGLPKTISSAYLEVQVAKATTHPTTLIQGVISSQTTYEVPLEQESADLQQRERRKKQMDAYRLRGIPPQPTPNAWRETVGMFRDDLEMQKTAEEGRKIREREQNV